MANQILDEFDMHGQKWSEDDKISKKSISKSCIDDLYNTAS